MILEIEAKGKFSSVSSGKSEYSGISKYPIRYENPACRTAGFIMGIGSLGATMVLYLPALGSINFW